MWKWRVRAGTTHKNRTPHTGSHHAMLDVCHGAYHHFKAFYAQLFGLLILHSAHGTTRISDPHVHSAISINSRNWLTYYAKENSTKSRWHPPTIFPATIFRSQLTDRHMYIIRIKSIENRGLTLQESTRVQASLWYFYYSYHDDRSTDWWIL